MGTSVVVNCHKKKHLQSPTAQPLTCLKQPTLTEYLTATDAHYVPTYEACFIPPSSISLAHATIRITVPPTRREDAVCRRRR